MTTKYQTNKYIQLINMQQTTIKATREKTRRNTNPYQSQYYPSQRQRSCCGKGSFKARFPKIIEQQQRCFCTIFCTFCCFFCTHKKVNVPEDEIELQKLLPISTPSFATKQNSITYTWIGHSTAVIAIGDKVNLMIDPVFSERCSPFQWIGPKRYRMPACDVTKLPKIHAVFLSHDHFDHMDQKSLHDLEQLHKPIFFAGLDSRDEFPKGCHLEQMDWTHTKSFIINGLTFQITFVPVAHWSKRKFYQRNTRLWGGFVIKTPKGHKIFYPGDTGYCQIFKQIGQLFGPFDLAILPIGAYQPRHLLQASHTSPEEAVMIHKQLRSKKSVGVHWGTFPLGFQHYYQPKQDLQKAKKSHGLAENQFVAIGHGQSFDIDYL